MTDPVVGRDRVNLLLKYLFAFTSSFSISTQVSVAFKIYRSFLLLVSKALAERP